MKAVKKMVTVNVAILIDKEDPKQCANEIGPSGKFCRFLFEDNGECILFSKVLKTSKGEEQYLRCKPCLMAEPIS